jgi:hypothetical protein
MLLPAVTPSSGNVVARGVHHCRHGASHVAAPRLPIRRCVFGFCSSVVSHWSRRGPSLAQPWPKDTGTPPDPLRRPPWSTVYSAPCVVGCMLYLIVFVLSRRVRWWPRPCRRPRRRRGIGRQESPLFSDFVGGQLGWAKPRAKAQLGLRPVSVFCFILFWKIQIVLSL